MPHCLYVGTLTDLSGFFPSKGAVEGGLSFIFIVQWLFVRLIIELIVYYFWLLLLVALRVVFSSFFLESATQRALTHVLSSGLPLPAPGLSGSLFVSGIRGLGSGCAAEWRLGEIVLWLSLQSLPWIGCFLRLGRCRLLQPAVILHRSNYGIPILHGKICHISIYDYLWKGFKVAEFVSELTYVNV